MRCLIYTAVWRRPEITELCFIGIKRLQRAGVIDIEAFAVVSEDWAIELCHKYDIYCSFYKNDPLGEKKNYGLTQALKLPWDYLIEIGSDDLLKNELLYLYRDNLNDQLYGLDNFIWLNSQTGECRTESSCGTFGTGRAIRRDVIEEHCKGIEVLAIEDLIIPGRSIAKGQKGFLRLKQAEQLRNIGRAEIIGNETYKLWSDKINRGLDNNSNFFLATCGVLEKKIKCNTPYVIDVKSKENIWAFNPNLGKPYPINEALRGLSEEEKNMIFSLIENASKV